MCEGALQLQQLQGTLDILLAPIRDNCVWTNIHVEEGFAEVLAAQGDTDLGVCKACIPRREEASCQGAILCKADSFVVP